MSLYLVHRRAIQYRFNGIFNFPESRATLSRYPCHVARRVSRCWLYITVCSSGTRLYQFRTGARVRCAARRENHRHPYKLPSRVLTKRVPPFNEKRRPINIARLAPQDRRCSRCHSYVFPTRTDCGPRGTCWTPIKIGQLAAFLYLSTQQLILTIIVLNSEHQNNFSSIASPR